MAVMPIISRADAWMDKRRIQDILPWMFGLGEDILKTNRIVSFVQLAMEPLPCIPSMFKKPTKTNGLGIKEQPC